MNLLAFVIADVSVNFVIVHGMDGKLLFTEDAFRIARRRHESGNST